MPDFLQTIMQHVGGWIGTVGGIGTGVTLAIAIGIALKKTTKEVTQAVEKCKWFFKKYRKFFQEGEGKKDYDAVLKEIDEALEAAAKILDKLRQKELANKLRGVIEL